MNTGIQNRIEITASGKSYRRGVAVSYAIAFQGLNKRYKYTV